MAVRPFTFDLPFQRAMLRLMMIDDDFCVRALKWIDKGHFTNEAFGWMFAVFEAYWATYQSRPTDLVLRESARMLPPDRALRYNTEVENVIARANVPEAGYIKEQLAEFVRQAIFATAHDTTAKMFNDGRRVEAYDVMARAMERINDVSFAQEDRIWLFDTLTERNRTRIRASMDIIGDRYSTGIPELDQLTDGGVHRGELWAVFAYAKRCKTTWLINQGFNATRIHRAPVVHFVLEGRGDQVAARYDACFSQELYTKVKQGAINPQLYSMLQNEYMMLRKQMVIRTLNDWDVTILDFERELHYLKSQGFDPEMMIVDYMDLGRSRDKTDSETQHQVNFARDLKRLVNNRQLACWSAWQAQRPKQGAHTKKHLLYSGSVADSYAKVRIVDAFGSLNATDEEMELGEMRVLWEGHRDAPVNRVWTITNDLSRMRMINSVVPYEHEEADGG
jgi:replicative DNA helicase